MTVVSMARKQAADRRSGFLWYRANGPGHQPGWQKVFASLRGGSLGLHRDDKAAQPLEVLGLQAGASVQEAVAETGKPPGKTARIICLQVPSQEIEELQSLLPQCGLTFAGDTRSCQLAAPDASEHTQWLKALKQACGGGALQRHALGDAAAGRPAGKGLRREPSQMRALEPPLAVSAFLCSPAAGVGRELLGVLQRTRRGLHEGVLNLGCAREEARRAQFALNSVRRHLRDVDLGIAHAARQPQQEAAAAAARDWLEQALLRLHDLDAALDSLQAKEPPFSTDWGSFGRDALLRLQALEEALWLGQFVARAQQDAAAEAAEAGGASGQSRRRLAMPHSHPAATYSHYRHRPAL